MSVSVSNINEIGWYIQGICLCLCLFVVLLYYKNSRLIYGGAEMDKNLADFTEEERKKAMERYHVLELI